MKMQIIKAKQDDGRTEYQVSDGVVMERSYSYDFYTLYEAELCLNDIVTNGEFTNPNNLMCLSGEETDQEQESNLAQRDLDDEMGTKRIVINESTLTRGKLIIKEKDNDKK
jgi:hypothetical protein